MENWKVETSLRAYICYNYYNHITLLRT